MAREPSIAKNSRQGGSSPEISETKCGRGLRLHFCFARRWGGARREEPCRSEGVEDVRTRGATGTTSLCCARRARNCALPAPRFSTSRSPVRPAPTAAITEPARLSMACRRLLDGSRRRRPRPPMCKVGYRVVIMGYRMVTVGYIGPGHCASRGAGYRAINGENHSAPRPEASADECERGPDIRRPPDHWSRHAVQSRTEPLRPAGAP